MDGQKLKSKFLEIRDRITNLENQLAEEIQELQERKEKWDIQDQEAETIKATRGKQKVRINIYGKRFTTTIGTLLSVKDSLFYHMILSNEVDFNEELFFETNPVMFSHILDFLRTNIINLKRFSKDELRELRKVAEYFEITEIVDKVGEEPIIYFEKMEFSGPYNYNGIVGTNKAEDLNDPSPLTGTCMTSPAWILLELNKEFQFDTIHIQGYTGNTNAWSPDNGVGANVKVSSDKKSWLTFGTIPTGFGYNPKTITSSLVKAKYLKIEGNSYLGIGHIRVENSSGNRLEYDDW